MFVGVFVLRNCSQVVRAGDTARRAGTDVNLAVVINVPLAIRVRLCMYKCG